MKIFFSFDVDGTNYFRLLVKHDFLNSRSNPFLFDLLMQKNSAK